MIINGKQIAEEILNELEQEIKDQSLKLQMAAVLVSNDQALKKFVELKEKAAKQIGVGFKSYFFDESISEDDLIKEIEKISAEPETNGVFIELPLPQHINAQNILNAITSEKDLDALSRSLQDRFYSGDFSILPPAVESVKIVFKKYGIDPRGKKVAIFGYGFLVGKPVTYWLEKQGAEVLVVRSKTENPGELSRQADIVITGVGKPDLVRGDVVKEGVIVIDFGYGKNAGGKMVGDVDFESVSSKASLITSVPGGMGPILIVAVLKNLAKLNS